MANTTNFGWETPDDTDLVKDGAAAMRTLGNAIDTSLVDLKGGTTDQVLAKNSNTDMDFKWVTSDDANAIQNAIVDAKGDLIAASAADTPARLAVGNNGETLVADSSASPTGLRWQGLFAAGKNKIINGDFNINQRAFTSTTTSNTYGFDRWTTAFAGDGTATYSAQTFTPGTAPVAGYESTNYARLVTASQTSAAVITRLEQRIEDVRTFAGQTATFSFWAKAASGTPKITLELAQAYGTGGTATANVYGGQVTISTTWQRYSITIAVPSVVGTTITSDSNLAIRLWVSAGSNFNARTNSMGIQNNTFDIWGVQFEAGSVATPFTTATGTLAGELAACQRYYQTITPGTAEATIGNFIAYNSTEAYGVIPLKVSMRTAPTISQTTATDAFTIVGNNTSDNFDGFSGIGEASTEAVRLGINSGIAVTQGYGYWVRRRNAIGGVLAMSAEL